MMTSAMDLGQFTGPSKKKIKLSTPDISQFQNGSIISLKLQNFVTYTLAEFQMSPSLNMIIGPNGSGKSTVVCAICLGLAGKTEYLGRASDASSYIKNGSPFATVEIILKDGDKTFTIKRRLIREKKNGGAEYWLNGEHCSEQNIRKYVQSKNIQLDNLCQFLSQERVEKFAALKPVLLLHETIRVIDGKLLTYLEDLKLLQEDELNVTKEIEVGTKKLQDLLKQKETLDENVRSMKEYELKNQTLKKNQLLLPYVYIQDHREKLESYKQDYKDAKNQLKLLMKKKQKFKNVTELIQNDKDIIDEKIVDTEHSLQQNKTQVKHYISELKKIRDEISKKQKQIQYYEGRSKLIKEKMKITEADLDSKRQDLNKIIVPEKEKIDEITEKRNDIIVQKQSKDQEIKDINNRAQSIDIQITRIKEKIKRKKNSQTNYDKLDLLDTRDRKDLIPVKNAMHEIRARSRDESADWGNNLLGPPLITISAKDPNFAPYISATIPYSSEIAITVASEDAFQKYANKILDNNAVNLRKLSNNEVPRTVERSELINRYGFEGYLTDFIAGDKRVIQMLREFHRIHMIPVSRKPMTDAQLELAMKPQANGKPLFNQIIHGDTLITVSVSQTNQIYKRTSNIERTNNSKFYASSVMSDEMIASINREIEDMNQQLKSHSERLEEHINETNEKNHELKELSHTFDKLNIELKRLNDIRSAHSKLKNDCKSLEEKLQKYDADSKKDVTTKIDDIREDISDDLKTELDLAEKMVLHVSECCTLEEKHINQQAERFKYNNMSISMSQVIQSLNDEEDGLNEEYIAKREAFETRKNSREYQEWKSQIETYDADLKAKLSKLAEKYINESNFTLQYINDIIDKLESEISRLNHDASSVKILERVERDIKQLNDVLPNQQKQLTKTTDEMTTKRSTLEPRLDDIITNISKKFAELFTRVGSAGAIRLSKPDLYSKWEIEILVKFRDNAALKQLDPHTQSGGERAVSTVLYMMALQDFTTAPFRVVDEINQGMDRRNERIVHKAMVENACKEHTSQYFLITPKLLTDLYYHERMRIHCVMAGPWIPNPSEDPDMQRFGETANYVM